MLKHERQTVAIELAAALHHSRDGGRETHGGPRAKKTASCVVMEVEEPEMYEAPRRPESLTGVRRGILFGTWAAAE